MLKKIRNIILQHQIKFVLSLHCSGDNSYFFVNGVLQIYLQTGVQLNQQKQDYMEMFMTLL